jgi:hypothetical protein
VGLKNLHIVNVPPGTAYWTPFRFFGDSSIRHEIEISTLTARGWKMGLVFDKQIKPEELKLKSITSSKPTREVLSALRRRVGEEIERFDTSRIHFLEKAARGGRVEDLPFPKMVCERCCSWPLRQCVREWVQSPLCRGRMGGLWAEALLPCG